jgi:hypothetical protein
MRGAIEVIISSNRHEDALTVSYTGAFHFNASPDLQVEEVIPART